MKKSLQILILFFIVNCSLLTVNCYSQWVQQTVPVSKPITGIKFIDILKGWAIVTNSSFDTSNILHTTNGGTNWFVQFTTTNGGEYNAISVIDSNIIYAGGGDASATAYLTKSTNGGLNWIVIPTPTNMFISDMQFLNKDSGWTCGYVGFGPDVRTTTNGGSNWTVRTSGLGAGNSRIFFLNYNTGFCTGDNSRIYKTSNGGLVWVQFYNAISTIYSIFFLNELTGWVGISNNRIRYTSDGGINWIDQTPPNNSGAPVFNIHFINVNTGWAGTAYNTIFKTTTGGTNWGYQNLPIFNGRIICILDSLNCWCGGTSTDICRTTNGGGPILAIEIISIELPKTFMLNQNYPNPFNPTTKINFNIRVSSFVSLAVFDVLGREVAMLINQNLKAGTYEYAFDSGNLPSGIYFYRLTTESYTETKKMILVK